MHYYYEISDPDKLEIVKIDNYTFYIGKKDTKENVIRCKESNVPWVFENQKEVDAAFNVLTICKESRSPSNNVAGTTTT